jgi:two-component system alkaline phosphatase synthesis response regulator PhoP
MVARRKVLVVDDDEDICQMIEYELVKQGFEVQTAPNRDVAFQRIILDGMPAVILLDFGMPGMDVQDFMRRLLELTTKPPRVILMTAAGEAHERARAVGVPEILSKPFDPFDLFSRVEPSRSA